MAALAPDLLPLLPAHLGRQRWYGAKHRSDVEVRVIMREELRPPWPALERVVVETGGERYQLLLGMRPASHTGSAVVDTAAVGLLQTRRGAVVCYDALADPDLGLVLLHIIAPDQQATTVRSIGVEQSNSSLVYDDRLILKVFRRLSGPNPEIEITLALAAQGFGGIAEPLAVWRRGGDDLALLQRFLAGAVDGWTLALASIAEGTDFVHEAERLGVVTAELHLALADAFGTQPADPAGWADTAISRLATVTHANIDVAAVAATIDRIRGATDAGQAIRIHGDYHLGQVIRSGDSWYVLDFEGEPSRPLAERTKPSSPLRDIAGLVRSLSYAAAMGARETDPERAAQWELSTRTALLDAYVERLQGSPILPTDGAVTASLLAAFELDKAVYEVGYEQAHRPGWVEIPLAAVSRLVLAK